MEFDTIGRGRNNRVSMGDGIMRLSQIVLMRRGLKLRGLCRLLLLLLLLLLVVLWNIERWGYSTASRKRRHWQPRRGRALRHILLTRTTVKIERRD